MLGVVEFKGGCKRSDLTRLPLLLVCTKLESIQLWSHSLEALNALAVIPRTLGDWLSPKKSEDSMARTKAKAVSAGVCYYPRNDLAYPITIARAADSTPEGR